VDLDLRKVRYFVALAEELNYGRAAERLHVAQPVLTRQIRSLERDLTAQLFERGRAGTRLTDAGRPGRDLHIRGRRFDTVRAHSVRRA
jgi:DNA-binding transcriptional LysR family regulator